MGLWVDRAVEQHVEALEVGRPVDEVHDGRRLLLVDPRCDVDQHEAIGQARRCGQAGQGGEAPERHAHEGRGVGGEGVDDRDDVVGHGLGPVVALGSPGRVTVSRQVDGHQRPVEGQGHRVPGVGVLGAAVQQHQLGRCVTPHQRAHLEARGGRHRGAPDRRRGERQADLGGVVRQHPELVVPVDPWHPRSLRRARGGPDQMLWRPCRDLISASAVTMTPSQMAGAVHGHDEQRAPRS